MNDLVPLIDLAPWFRGDPASRGAIARSVDDACRNVGFLQITGHGVPDGVIDALRTTSDDFFALPISAKSAAASPSPEVNRGYAARGAEGLAYSLGVVRPPDLFEAFNIGPEDVDPTDPFVAAERHRIFAANIWPPQCPGLRNALVTYFAEARRVAHLLTDVFAVALGCPSTTSTRCTDRSTDTLRVVHYETGPGDPEPVDGQVGMGAHTDYGICTVLYADRCPGSQIVGPDQEWHDVVPRRRRPAGQPRRPARRVDQRPVAVDDPPGRRRPLAGRTGRTARRSAAFFHDGNYDALVTCLPTCTDADHPPRYAPVTAGDHLMAKLLGPADLAGLRRHRHGRRTARRRPPDLTVSRRTSG